MQALVLTLVLLTAALWQSRASGLFEGFEGRAVGVLDANLSLGANEGTNGGANPWFGPNPPNLRVVDPSPCSNASNRRSWVSTGMPTPVSVTAKYRRHPSAGSVPRALGW